METAGGICQQSIRTPPLPQAITCPKVGSLIAPTIISAPPVTMRCTSRPSILSPRVRISSEAARRTSALVCEVQAHRLVLGLVQQRLADGLDGDRQTEPDRSFDGLVDRRGDDRSRHGNAGGRQEGVGLDRRQPAAAALQHTFHDQSRQVWLDVRHRRNHAWREAAPFAIGGDSCHRDRRRLREREARNPGQRVGRVVAAHEDPRHWLAAARAPPPAAIAAATSSASVTSGGMKITSTLSTLGSAISRCSDVFVVRRPAPMPACRPDC